MNDKLTTAIEDFNGHVEGCRHGGISATSHTACCEHSRLMTAITNAAKNKS